MTYYYPGKGNHYTKNINFKNADKKPVYMKVLHAMSKTKNGATRKDLVFKVWNVNLDEKSRGWNCGPFTLLRQNGYADYLEGIWKITPKGKMFLKKMWT